MNVDPLNFSFSATSGRSEDPLAGWWRNLSSRRENLFPMKGKKASALLRQIDCEFTLNPVCFDGQLKYSQDGPVEAAAIGSGCSHLSERFYFL